MFQVSNLCSERNSKMFYTQVQLIHFSDDNQCYVVGNHELIPQSNFSLILKI